MPEPQDFVPASAAADKEMAPWLESLRLMAGTLGPRRPFLPALTDLLRMLASRHAFLRAHLVLFEPETELLRLVDEDTEAFNRIMAAFSMPKATDEDKKLRSEAIQRATLFAAQVPLETMKASSKVFELCRAMVEQGNPNSVSDAGVGALAARAAVMGAGLNVKINAASLKDKGVADGLVAEADRLMAEACGAEAAIIEMVNKVINKD